MPHNSIHLSISVESLYNQLVQALSSSLQCEPHELDQRNFETTLNIQGKPVVVSQKVVEMIHNEKIAFESQMNLDKILTIYRCEAIDEDNSKITMIEHASSRAIFRSLNYLILSLPGLNLFSKSQIKNRLLAMKYQFERNEL
jgi:hypothetical protein